MQSNHLVLCRSLLLLPSICLQSIRDCWLKKIAQPESWELCSILQTYEDFTASDYSDGLLRRDIREEPGYKGVLQKQKIENQNIKKLLLIKENKTSQWVQHFSMYPCMLGNGNPLQYSCLENSMERGAWWAPVGHMRNVCSREVTKSDTTEWLTHMHAKSLQSCLTLCDPMDCSLPGSSVHGILQARILEWVAMSFSRGSLQPRNRAQVSLLPEPWGQGKMYGKMSMYGKTQKSGFIKTVPLMCTLSRYVGPVFCFPPSWIASGCVVQSGCND